MIRRQLCAVLVAASAAAGSGCYTYAPVAPASAPVGAAVRVRLTAQEAERVHGLLGRDDRLLEGTIMEAVPDAVVIAVPTTAGTATPGLASGQLHQRISVPVPGVVEMETRRLDKFRTGLLVGGIAAAVGVVIGTQFVGTDSPEGEDKPGEDRLVVPVFSFFIGRR
jgi:hypothetical protein